MASLMAFAQALRVSIPGIWLDTYRDEDARIWIFLMPLQRHQAPALEFFEPCAILGALVVHPLASGVVALEMRPPQTLGFGRGTPPQIWRRSS